MVKFVIMSQRGNYQTEINGTFYWPSKQAWIAQMRLRRDIDKMIRPFFINCCDGLLWLINKF